VTESIDGFLEGFLQQGTKSGTLVAVAIGDNTIGMADNGRTWSVDSVDPMSVVRRVEDRIRPRWVWWSSETAATLTTGGVRVATCWDLAAVHRLLFGGWRADPAQLWAALHGLPQDSIPQMGQLDLLEVHGDDGIDPEDPVRPDGHLRPEWVADSWQSGRTRTGQWAALALRACLLQQDKLRALPAPNSVATTARSESVAELLCVELARDGLPIDVACAEETIARSVGIRPRSDADAATNRERRDAAVLAYAPDGVITDLRNPAHVKAMLAAAGIHVENTRAYRLEQFRTTHPLVDALLTWRKAERIATTYGYAWLDEHVGSDGRLRGQWTGCDGAAGRMTASAGLHNLPAEMRTAVVAEPGHVFVHADLGQIEPRVLAAVSGDPALAAATQDDDLYAPVAERLGVERGVAKIAVLAAMYGQTTGAAGETLRAMEIAYPVAMKFLADADRCGRSGVDVRTYGGRLVRMRADVGGFGAAAAQGRYARNAVIQGAAAELFKVWAVTLRARLPSESRIVLCLHDELLIHVPSEHGPSEHGASEHGPSEHRGNHGSEVAALLERTLHEASRRWMPDSPVRYVTTARCVARWSDAK
jgi:DNA polymerase I